MDPVVFCFFIIGSILAVGVSSALSNGAKRFSDAVYLWIKSREARLADEQEHRQKLERAKARESHKLAVAEKLHEVMAIALADKAMSTSFRDEINKVYPLVRVDAEEIDEEVEVTKQKSRRQKR